MTRTRVPAASSPNALRRMKAQRQRDTAIELSLRSLLHARGLRFRVNHPIASSRRTVDIAFPKQRVAIFVDGCFWHGCPRHGTQPKANAAWWKQKIDENRRRDAETDSLLRSRGWRVIRFWEHDDPDVAAEMIAAVVKEEDTPPGAAIR